MSATANIFVGQTEAPLVVRPFIASMTRSELFAVMCGGLASVAGSVLAGYASLGIPMEYLIAASFMAAPGGLLFAKLLMPETETPDDSISRAEEKIEADDKPANVLDAAATGATSGMMLAANVGAMLLAFIGLIALINGILGGVGGWFGMDSLSLEMILGWLFAPLAFLLGIPWSEATLAGSFIGQKIVVNEFVAFINLGVTLNVSRPQRTKRNDGKNDHEQDHNKQVGWGVVLCHDGRCYSGHGGGLFRGHSRRRQPLVDLQSDAQRGQPPAFS